MLKEFCRKKNELVNLRGPDGDFPIHFVRSKKMLETLLNYGASAQSRCLNHKRLPFDVALRTGMQGEGFELLKKATFDGIKGAHYPDHISAQSLYLLDRKDEALVKVLLNGRDFEGIFFLACAACEKQDAAFFREWISRGKLALI